MRVTWRGVPHLAALGGAVEGREERHVGGAEGRMTIDMSVKGEDLSD